MFRDRGFRALGFRVLGFRVLGFRVLGFRVLGLGCVVFKNKKRNTLPLSKQVILELRLRTSAGKVFVLA